MHVLLTGAATGFGRLTTELLSSAGHRIFATMRGTADRNATAAAALGMLPGVRVLEMDVRLQDSVTGAVEQALSEAGHLDAVVNNAGHAGFGLTEGFSVEQWQAVFDTNLLGCVRVNNAVLPSMRARRSGLLVHISSIAGRVAVPYLVPYASSKWAVECYAESLRLELTPLGIDSVVLEPGKFRTEIFAKADDAPRSPALEEEYGSANLRERFLDWFMTEMNSMAQDPRDVATAIGKLLGMGFGTRPFRTTVGADVEWVKPYNDLADGIRKGVASRMGLSELVQEASANPAEDAESTSASS